MGKNPVSDFHGYLLKVSGFSEATNNQLKIMKNETQRY